MKFDSVDDIYTTNTDIAAELESLVGKLPQEAAEHRPEGEKWSVAEIVEHLAMVEDGMSRICAKLIGKAEKNGEPSDGTISITSTFEERGVAIAKIKVEAPEMVQPTGERSISESFAMMAEANDRLEQIRPLFATFDGNKHRFPHPFFGDLSAIEWLVLVGQHKARHIAQIRRLLASN
ncbi:MAG: DinB family protein [Acidobacteria bacterium]|nr:DinB family protein [Acidobacteriota bacterium]